MNLRINRVINRIFCQHSFLAFAAASVLLLIWMMFEFFILLKNNCLLLHGKVVCSAGFLHVCDWSDASNTSPLCERAVIQIGKPWVDLPS